MPERMSDKEFEMIAKTLISVSVQRRALFACDIYREAKRAREAEKRLGKENASLKRANELGERFGIKEPR